MQKMDFDEKSPKKYCMKKKHVAIICGVVIAVGLILGLALGLSRPKDCHVSEEEEQVPTGQPTSPAPEDRDPCPAQNDDSGDWRNFRLPLYINPLHYDLELIPEMEADRYTGTVTISIMVNEPAGHLRLHLRETKITEMPLLMKSSGEPITVKRCFEYEPQEYIVIEAEEELLPNTYFLTMKFQGHLNGSLVGFYRTTYIENGMTKVWKLLICKVLEKERAKLKQ
ncbi:UNVERIFIED_CONTAM: hypothetical protein K2H54_035295 [Gekko kuhli]